MARRITVGIDVGTYQVKVVVAEEHGKRGRLSPVILGTGFAQSKGLRHGYIINASDLTKSLKTAIAQAQQSSGILIKKAYLAVGGIGLDELRARAEVIVSRADLTVSDLDLSNVIEECERKVMQKNMNRKIIHSIPLTYRVDGQQIFGRPQGMKGTKLEADTLFITTLEQHLQDLITVIEDLGISVVDVMASPLAASFVTLTKAQKVAGCVLANIGAETVSIVVFENNVPISLKVFPIGATDVTNDIALGFKVSLDDAEQMKRGTLVGTDHSRKRLEEIISGRLTDIFSLIEAHLKKIGRSGLLPAGVIISGGGSGIATVEDIARAALQLPSRKATLHGLEDAKIKDSAWAVAYGLCIWGLSSEEESVGFTLAKQTGGKIINWIKQFLP